MQSSKLKSMVYDEGREAKKSDRLKRRITKKLKEIDTKVIQAMFSGIRNNFEKLPIMNLMKLALHDVINITIWFFCLI